MVLLSFELVMILTKRNKYLSLLGSFWITFSPSIQWWFMQHVGDLMFFTLAIMVASYYYIARHENRLLRLFMMALIVINGIGFVLVLYPAHQVPLAYLILFWLFGTLIHFRKELVLDVWDLPIIIGGLGIIGVVLFHFYSTSKEAIDATLNTIYPGHREAGGGGRPQSDYFLFLTNWKIPFEDFNFHGTNNGEVASYFNFLPLTVLLSPFIFFSKQGKDEKYMGVILGLFCCFMFGWTYFGYSHGIAKVLMLTYVTSTRGLVTLGFGAVLLSLWMINFFWEYVRITWWVKLIFLALIMIKATHAVVSSIMGLYFNNFEIFMTLVIFALILFCLLFKLKKVFILAMTILILVSGFSVNPVVHGTGAIDKKTLAEEIVKIKKEDPEALWLSEADLYNFTPALGVKTINSVRFYPDMALWHKIDPKHKQEKIYNRYAHVRAFVDKGETSFRLDRPDNFTVTLNFTDCKKLGFKYVISKRPLEDYNALNYAQFDRIYGPDKDKWSIYKLSFTSDEDQMQPEDAVDPIGGTEDYQEIPQPAPNYDEYIN
jgi:MFS family permease